MTSSNVPDVPNADGPEHAVFLSRVGHEVTNARYAMKKRVSSVPYLINLVPDPMYTDHCVVH
jgi:hypothetical protein